MRTAHCLTCDEPFAPVPRHPMVEQAHCDACLAILRPVWRDMYHALWPGADDYVRPERADDV